MASALSTSAQPTYLNRAAARSRFCRHAIKSIPRCTVLRSSADYHQQFPTTASPADDQSPSATPLVAESAALKAGLDVSAPFMLMALAAACSMAMPEHATAHMEAVTSTSAVPQFDVAEGGEEFFTNIARYGRYFVTVMLGTGYVMVKPILNAFKNPVTAVLTIGALVGGTYFVKFTLEAMLGVSSEPFEYVQGQF